MTHHDSVDAALDLGRLVLDVAGQPCTADMVCRVTQLAAKLIDGVATDLIRVTAGGQLRILASSDPGLSSLTEKAWRRWPHSAISEDGAEVMGTRLRRSSYLQQLRSDTCIVQELIVPLVVGQTDHGCLRFLFPEAATTADRALVTAFSAHAAIALDRAALMTQVENLQLALKTNREIGAAIGVLMTRHQLTYPQGLARLKVASQHSNRRVHDVAVEVLYTGDNPMPGRQGLDGYQALK